MSKAKAIPESKDQDLRPEYGASTIAEGVRGKYHKAYSAGSNLALLAPDVRAAFPSDDEVNQARATECPFSCKGSWGLTSRRLAERAVEPGADVCVYHCKN